MTRTSISREPSRGRVGSARPEAFPSSGRHVDRSTVQAIDQLVGDLGDTSIVVTLVRTFLDELPEQRLAITEGAESGDLERVRRAAHTLKSTGRLLGAIDLSDAATELEVRAGSADGDLGRLARNLDDAAERASIGFVAILDSMGDGAQGSSRSDHSVSRSSGRWT